MTDVVVVPEPEPESPVVVLEPGTEGAVQVPDSGPEIVVVIEESGPAGPKGAQGEPGAVGPAGPPGPPGVGGGGGGASMVVVDFPVPATVWVVDVGLSATLEVFNSANEVVWPGDTVYGPGTKITLHFSAPFSGKVHCYF